MDSMMSRIMLASAAVGIPLSFALSSLFGAQGAAAASVTLATLMVLAMMASLRLRGLRVWQRFAPEASPVVTS
jgi:O-antigen/teichoic acid export membrane protein